MLSLRDAFELGTQLKTFTLRVRAANANAARLARFLTGHRKVKHVLYPGLPNSPSHTAAFHNFGSSRCFGAVVTLDLAEPGAGDRLMHALEPAGIRCRLTLGDTETTLFAIREVFGAERFGHHPEMLRVSVGTEPWDELERAFTRIVNLAARGMLVVSVAWRLRSEGPLLAYCAARSNRAGPQKGALGPLS